MKFFVVAVFLIGYVSGRGSGPYLPRGWKPEGPAFFLPSEVAEPSSSPVQDTIIEDTETSGSDALREYGPPKLELFVNVNQGLPDISTEQAFLTEAKNLDIAAPVEQQVALEVNTEQAALVVVEVSTATDSGLAELVQAVQEQVTEVPEVQAIVLSEEQPTVEVLALDITEVDISSTQVPSQEADEAVVPTLAVQEEDVAPTAAIVEEIIIPTAAAEELTVSDVKVIEAVPTTVEAVISEKVEVGVNNIGEALVNLENEVKTNEAIENTAEIRSTLETLSFLDQAPEGFLEYGPPGFTEYGPPKGDNNTQTSADLVAEKAVESNEVRRRRFSPKFKSTKKH